MPAYIAGEALYGASGIYYDYNVVQAFVNNIPIYPPIFPDIDPDDPIWQELPQGRNALPGSVAFVPAAAGLIIAGEVIKDLALK